MPFYLTTMLVYIKSRVCDVSRCTADVDLANVKHMAFVRDC